MSVCESREGRGGAHRCKIVHVLPQHLVAVHSDQPALALALLVLPELAPNILHTARTCGFSAAAQGKARLGDIPVLRPGRLEAQGPQRGGGQTDPKLGLWSLIKSRESSSSFNDVIVLLQKGMRRKQTPEMVVM